jgi:hypothetical protein
LRKQEDKCARIRAIVPGLERELHILIKVGIFYIAAPVVHTKEIPERGPRGLLAMLYIMSDKRGSFE